MKRPLGWLEPGRGCLWAALVVTAGCYSGLDPAAEAAGDGTGSPADDTATGGSASDGGAGTTGEDGVGDPDTGTDGGEPHEVDLTESTRAARLTHTQYDRTASDLLGLDVTVSEQFAPDAQNGFRYSTSVHFAVDARLGPQYRSAAEELAAQVVSTPQSFATVVPCEPSQGGEGGQGGDCAETFVRSFGERAFRRPLSDDEVGRFVALFDQGDALYQSGDAFADGVQLVVETMLQSPQFLYRIELSTDDRGDGRIELNDWEIAARLSFFLWDSMPDDELFDAARAGRLRDADEVEAQALRMLGDPRATQKLVAFHEQAWDFDRISGFSPDPNVFPDAPSIPSIRASNRRFVEAVLERDGGLVELLTASYAFANAELAPLYGTDVVGDDLQEIALDPTERKGVLGQVGFLASHAYAVKTDPIHRGLLVARNLLCVTIPDPPPGAAMMELPPGADPQTTREEIELLTGGNTCAGCHQLINPPGYAFENFDALGQPRDEENGVPIDTSGTTVIDGEMVAFSNAPELIDAIASSQAARACYTEGLLEFALGRVIGSATAAEVRDALAQAPSSTHNLATDITLSDVFLSRPQDEVE